MLLSLLKWRDIHLGSVVEKADYPFHVDIKYCVIHRMAIYPEDSVVHP